MSVGSRLGRLEFLKGRGAPWIETLRSWLLVAMGASATGRWVFELSREWSAAILIVVPILGEVLALVLGVVMARFGVIQAHYAAARDLDPYRQEHLQLLREIRDELRRDDDQREERRNAIDSHLRTLHRP